MENLQIQNTTDYDQFKSTNKNRPVTVSHVRKLKESIIRHNLLHANPIIVSQDMEIIDGQHRLEVAKQLGLPICYVVTDATENDMRSLNASSKNWTLRDYLNSYVEEGLEDYIILKAYIDAYPITLHIAIRLLRDGIESITAKQTFKAETSATDEFREGTYVVKCRRDGEMFGDFVKFVAGYMADLSVDRTSCSALAELVNRGYKDQFVAKLKQYKPSFLSSGTRNGYLRQFEDVLSIGELTKVSLFD